MTVRAIPVALFLIEIVTPGITAPVASVTVPESVAPLTWAYACPLKKKVQAITKPTTSKLLNGRETSLIDIGASAQMNGPSMPPPLPASTAQRGPKVYL
jgi:hypothetical protein